MDNTEKTKFEKSVEKIKSLINAIDGKTDYKKQIEILLNPANSQTSSKLSLPQVYYIQDAFWLSQNNIYPELYCLKQDAIELTLSMLSHEGFGIKETIDLQRALTHGEKETVVEKETFRDKVKKISKGEKDKQ